MGGAWTERAFEYELHWPTLLRSLTTAMAVMDYDRDNCFGNDAAAREADPDGQRRLRADARTEFCKRDLYRHFLSRTDTAVCFGLIRTL